MLNPPDFLTSEQAVEKIQKNIFSNAAQRPWLIQYVKRNQIAIQALIENDIFGSLSDFDDENPAPSKIKQVKILQSLLKGEVVFEEYDLKDILAPLITFTNNVPEQSKALDNVLLMAQLGRQESWRTTLPYSIKIQLGALNQIQILNQMERMLNEIEQEEDKVALLKWLKEQRTQTANKPFSTIPPSEMIYLIAGADQVSKFIRNEMNAIMTFYTRTRTRVQSISTFNLREVFNIRLFLTDGVDFTLHLGKMFLLPYRFGITLCRQA